MPLFIAEILLEAETLMIMLTDVQTDGNRHSKDRNCWSNLANETMTSSDNLVQIGIYSHLIVYLFQHQPNLRDYHFHLGPSGSMRHILLVWKKIFFQPVTKK